MRDNCENYDTCIARNDYMQHWHNIVFAGNAGECVSAPTRIRPSLPPSPIVIFVIIIPTSLLYLHSPL